MNLEYALFHGYDLIFFQLQGTGCAHSQCGAGCTHTRWGARHASYCKVAALGAALSTQRYNWVVYIDSDAFMSNLTVSLPNLLSAYGVHDPNSADSFFGWDHPFTLGPNMGFIVLRNTTLARDLVRTWWNLDAGKYAMEHPFEQRTLQWGIMHMRKFRDRMVTLPLRTMDPDAHGDGEAVVHLDHTAGTKTRLWTMAAATAELLCRNNNRNGRSRKQWNDHSGDYRDKSGRHGDAEKGGMHFASSIRQTKAIGAQHARNLSSGLSGCSPIIRSALTQLRKSRQEVRLGSGKRDKVLDALLMTTCRSFNASRQMPLTSFDASMFGSTKLSQPEVNTDALRGLPLHLANCSSIPHVAAWQTWSYSTLSNMSFSKSATSARLSSKKSLCGGGACTETTRLALAAYPTLCLTLGTSRSPRSPYSVVAQLESCTETELARSASRSSATRVETRASLMRSRLRFNATSGVLRTAATVNDMRRWLPEHRHDCGFWSNCSKVRTVLPKPCWNQLERSARSCGKSEPKIAAALQRAANTSFSSASRRFVVTPEGPTPFSAIGPNGRSALCMQAWRGSFTEGQAITFVRCPAKATPKALRGESSARAHRWKAAELFQWRAIVQPALLSPGSLPVELVRLVPRMAPNLCASVPALIASRG